MIVVGQRVCSISAPRDTVASVDGWCCFCLDNLTQHTSVIALLIVSTFNFQHLDEPRSQVSSLLQPPYAHSFYGAKGAASPMLIDEIWYVKLSRFPRVKLCLRKSPRALGGGA